MIKILMLDLGDTLVKGDRLLPHVREALGVISKFETETGETLILSLVSDFDMPTPPPTAAKVTTIFKSYVDLLHKVGLQEFFEPVDRRVTLSAHAGVFKPDVKIFQKAIQRLRIRASLDQCMFITENAQHLSACRKLGMSTLQFDPTGAARTSFSDWVQAPLMIARVVNSKSTLNERLALQLQLAANHDIELVSVTDSKRQGVIHARARKLFPVPLKNTRGAKETVQVPVPIEVEITIDKNGRVSAVHDSQPDPEALAESAHFVQTLQANNQISHGEGATNRNQTHEVKVDDKGRKLLVRRRYSAT